MDRCTHSVHTAVALAMEDNTTPAGWRSSSFVESSRVTFAPLTEEDVLAYVESGEGIDKAGAYGIQGLGGQLVCGIAGCYFNVMGLPLHRLSTQLAELLAE